MQTIHRETGYTDEEYMNAKSVMRRINEFLKKNKEEILYLIITILIGIIGWLYFEMENYKWQNEYLWIINDRLRGIVVECAKPK